MGLKIKDSGLRLRVERDLREEFMATCRAEGKTAAQVLRDCMRQFVERAHAGQQELFVGKRGEGRAPVVNSSKKERRAKLRKS